jgi:hypothetical protein
MADWTSGTATEHQLCHRRSAIYSIVQSPIGDPGTNPKSHLVHVTTVAPKERHLVITMRKLPNQLLNHHPLPAPPGFLRQSPQNLHHP